MRGSETANVSAMERNDERCWEKKAGYGKYREQHGKYHRVAWELMLVIEEQESSTSVGRSLLMEI